MYHYISSKRDHDDKLCQANQAYDRADWRTSLGRFEACLQYAEHHGMSTSDLEMKVDECKRELGI